MPLFHQFNELFNSQPGLFDNCAKGPLCDLLVIWNHQAAMRIRHLSENYVATFPAILFLTKLNQNGDDFPARDPGKNSHMTTSTISSLIDGGICISLQILRVESLSIIGLKKSSRQINLFSPYLVFSHLLRPQMPTGASSSLCVVVFRNGFYLYFRHLLFGDFSRRAGH